MAVAEERPTTQAEGDAVVEAWEEDLRAALVTPPDHVRDIAAAAAAAVPAGAATGAVTTAMSAGAAAGLSVGAKIAAAAALVVALGGAAAAGVLPDPVQRWLADLVDGVGIELPRPPSIDPGDPDLPIDVELPLVDELPADGPIDVLP